MLTGDTLCILSATFTEFLTKNKSQYIVIPQNIPSNFLLPGVKLNIKGTYL